MMLFRTSKDVAVLSSFEVVMYLNRLAALFLLVFVSSCSIENVDSDSKPVEHDEFDRILKEYVDDDGQVDYKGLQADSAELNTYLDLLSANHPNEKFWSEDEQLAYWINAYNAFTLRLIIRNFPIESIRDITPITLPFISSPWDIKFIQIENERYDLNNIEHGFIRSHFKEPRIHFALVCAAKSCPKLRNEAYTATRLDEQLQEQSLDFINDSRKNQVTKDDLRISKIFSWYEGDFEENGDLIDFIGQYSEIQPRSNATIDYLDYNWNLNQQ